MEMLNPMVDIIYFGIPLFSLFGLFLVGYYLAWIDFRPKQVNKNEEYQKQHLYKPKKSSSNLDHRKLSDRELGLPGIDNQAALSEEDQRYSKMAELTREYSEASPEATAEVIRGWLSER